MVAPDCFGCRASVPRYCASCVQQAITERRQRLKEIEGDKYRLERGMRPSLAQRRRLLEQREARRVHAASTARLSAELTSVRAESDRQAITVNEIRHAIRRHQLQLQQPPKLTRASRGIRAVRTGYAYRPPACSTYRRHRAACPRAPSHGTPYQPRAIAKCDSTLKARPLAVPQLAPCSNASSGRAGWLWAARHSQGEVRPPGSPSN